MFDHPVLSILAVFLLAGLVWFAIFRLHRRISDRVSQFASQLMAPRPAEAAATAEAEASLELKRAIEVVNKLGTDLDYARRTLKLPPPSDGPAA